MKTQENSLKFEVKMWSEVKDDEVKSVNSSLVMNVTSERRQVHIRRQTGEFPHFPSVFHLFIHHERSSGAFVSICNQFINQNSFNDVTLRAPSPYRMSTTINHAKTSFHSAMALNRTTAVNNCLFEVFTRLSRKQIFQKCKKIINCENILVIAQ